MKKKMRCVMFGNPQIFLNDQPVFFAFSKINALFYYLSVNGPVSRDEIAGILWSNKSEKSAKKNLRNTIYQANKELEDEFIVSPNKSILQLNEELIAPSDVDLFLEDPINHLDEYQDDFLKGYFLKDSEIFDLWVTKMRNYFEQKFIQNCYQKVSQDIENNHLIDVEKNIGRLIAIDEYDERNYQMLMRFYQDSHRNGKVIETYYGLSMTLDEELGIKPSEETRAIYEKTLAIVKRNKEQKKARNYRFFGRTKEIEVLEANLDSFFQKQPFQSVLIQGDDGIGKSALSRLVLSNATKKTLIKVTCFQTEQGFTLRMWREIITQLDQIIINQKIINEEAWQAMCRRFFPSFFDKRNASFEESVSDADINYLSQFLLAVLKEVSKTHFLIIWIENLQWIDPRSLQLLTSILLHNEDIMFLLTLRTDHQKKIKDFINAVSHYDKLIQLSLEPFPRESVKAFVERQIPDQKYGYELYDRLYEESEGNPLFLMEYVKQLKNGSKLEYMTPKMQEELEFSLTQLPTMEKEVLEIISFFRDAVQISIIDTLLEADYTQIANAVANLRERNILIERVISGEIYVCFKQKKLKEYIYSKLSATKVRVTHEQIARLFEQQWKDTNDKNLLSSVAYHYKYADQELKSLDYELYKLEISLKFQHELFPIYSEQSEKTAKPQSLEWQKEFEKFEKIGKFLKDNEEMYGERDDYQQLLMKYLYLEGRYFINLGNYPKGIENIQRVISKAKEYHNDPLFVKSYRQMIYYFIQTDNAGEMLQYIELAMKMSIRMNDHESIGILLRLKGLYNLMIGQLEEAERLFHESITIFTISDEVREKYASNIAASYDYLAEIERLRENYDKAMSYHKKAIVLCEETNLYTSLAIFYVGMGISAFAAENYKEARKYLERSNEMHMNLTSPWKKTQLSVYLALIDLLEGNYEAVSEAIINFNDIQNQMENPRDIGMLYFYRATVKHLLNTNKITDSNLNKLLDKEEEYYYEKALENLSPYRDQFEINNLNQLIKGKG
ncbi:AAA family ATPase [Vagococcus elongatus]|uniref:Bacterial transcriptional activator domain-containing protein n=1 Tax=Vagococcus elongatus TaxID=180344 RepID=A0A430ANH4_9ENTE|nr:AAA family ATPase [Vagococcus elongatus]RSU09474.1 hypothetical protein CBF29_11540 [Vagococcus elongatus]